MIRGTARLKFEKGRGLHADFNSDFLRYYLWLYNKSTYNFYAMTTSRFGAHISITLDGIHNFNDSALKKYVGKTIVFYYDPRQIYSGGRRKGFLGFYMPIKSEDIDLIRKELGIPNDLRNSLHISLFNDKSFRALG